MRELPSGWNWSTLGELAEVQGGITKGNKRRSDEAVRPVPYLRVANVQRGFLDLSEMKEIEASESQITRLNLLSGDVLFNEGGDRDKLGRGWVWSGELPECIHQNHVFRARLRPGLMEPKFLSYYGNSEAQHYFESEGKQTTNLASISLTKLVALPVIVPPCPEQRRIVAKLEELFSELDAGVEALRRAQRRLARYRQSLLQAAVTGELTREWREQQTLDVQLGKRNIEGGPDGWQTCKVTALLSEPLCNGLSIKESTSPTEVRALKLNAMGERGFDYNEHRYLPISWSEVDDLAIKNGDLFVSRGNGSLRLVGRAVLATTPPFSVIFPDTMIRLRVKDSLGGWVNAIWPSRFIRSQIESAVKTTAGIWKINQGELENIEVPLPSEPERTAILSELDRRLSTADALEATLQASLRRAERMRQSILERAFRGELVPQDPGDEPAETMMARLRDVPAGSPAPSRRGRPSKAQAEAEALKSPRRRGRPRKADKLASGAST